MKTIFKAGVLALIFLNLACLKGYSIDDREKFGQVPNPQPPQGQQPPRPMLPPVIPSSPFGISPTPSPNITAPVIPQTAITGPSFPANFQPAVMQTNFQSSPAQIELPQVPIIGNSLGKVVNTGIESGGLPWIEVKDELFNETLKIKINPKSTPVIKKSTVLSFRDIKIGDTVNVIFNQQDENMTANFVSIMTEEDLKAMEESLKAQSNLQTENKAKDSATKDNPAPAAK